MKTFNASKYSYVAEFDGYYIFKSSHIKPEDQEWVVVSQARVLNLDGTVTYYNKRKHADRLNAYAKLVNNIVANRSSDERVCLTQVQRPTHIPKRNVAGSNEPVKISKSEVSHLKRVRAMN
jgi:hypothetical protein